MRSLWAFRTESGTVVPAAEAAIFQMEDLPMIRTKAIAITLLSCCAAAAGTVDLYFNQLPSTLGWNYNTPVAAGTTGAAGSTRRTIRLSPEAAPRWNRQALRR